MDNKAIYQRFIDQAFNKGNLNVLDEIVATRGVADQPLEAVAEVAPERRPYLDDQVLPVPPRDPQLLRHRLPAAGDRPGLAELHARFLGEAPEGLWSEGSYWHLATRLDELAHEAKQDALAVG